MAVYVASAQPCYVDHRDILTFKDCHILLPLVCNVYCDFIYHFIIIIEIVEIFTYSLFKDTTQPRANTVVMSAKQSLQLYMVIGT